MVVFFNLSKFPDSIPRANHICLDLEEKAASRVTFISLSELSGFYCHSEFSDYLEVSFLVSVKVPWGKKLIINFIYIGGRVTDFKEDSSSDHHCRLESSHKSFKRGTFESGCGSWVSNVHVL